MVYAAGYFPRVLSKNNLVKMRTENHRPLLPRTYAALISLVFLEKQGPEPESSDT